MIMSFKDKIRNTFQPATNDIRNRALDAALAPPRRSNLIGAGGHGIRRFI
jgi:hypothetical protein